MCDRRNLNVSRRLMYMLKVSGLPRVGGAHTLRMRYVQVKHALLILQGKCTRESIAKAKHEIAKCGEARKRVGSLRVMYIGAGLKKQNQTKEGNEILLLWAGVS